MWNLFIRLGVVVSTVLLGRQFVDQFLPIEIRPARLYRVHHIARYLGTSPEHVYELIASGTLAARWIGGEPVILGANVIEYLSRGEQVASGGDL